MNLFISIYLFIFQYTVVIFYSLYYQILFSACYFRNRERYTIPFLPFSQWFGQCFSRRHGKEPIITIHTVGAHWINHPVYSRSPDHYLGQVTFICLNFERIYLIVLLWKSCEFLSLSIRRRTLIQLVNIHYQRASFQLLCIQRVHDREMSDKRRRSRKYTV